MNGVSLPPYREVNGHIHTPYSFSAFDNMEQVFRMAKEENISVLGINDFYVADGYFSFFDGCLANNLFPLFNIEFIGLLKEEQEKGIRINDPNNPGRIYFSGKGLDYPFSPGWLNRWKLRRVKRESQKQVKVMISKLNALMRETSPSLLLSYKEIREKYARELVRERHLARAVRYLAAESFSDPGQQIGFIESLYGGKKSKAGMANPAALENEIRSNLLKSGGPAFVEENNSSFLGMGKVIKIIIKAGGIPCYPVLLDDPSGKLTEYESNMENLCTSLASMGVGCIELIPGRNDIDSLRDFVEFFNSKGFIILFGTEHNTPELAPLTVSARGTTPLDERLKRIAWEGACVVAAHQYLRAHDRQGYILGNGKPGMDQKNELAELGELVIEYFINRELYESEN